MHFYPSSIALLCALTLHALPPASAAPPPCSPLMSSILNPVAWTLYKQLYCDVASPPTSAKNPANDDSIFDPKGPANEDSAMNAGSVAGEHDRFGGDNALSAAHAPGVDKPVIVVVGHDKEPPLWQKPHEGKPQHPPKRPKPPKRKVSCTVRLYFSDDDCIFFDIQRGILSMLPCVNFKFQGSHPLTSTTVQRFEAPSVRQHMR